MRVKALSHLELQVFKALSQFFSPPLQSSHPCLLEAASEAQEVHSTAVGFLKASKSRLLCHLQHLSFIQQCLFGLLSVLSPQLHQHCVDPIVLTITVLCMEMCSQLGCLCCCWCRIREMAEKGLHAPHGPCIVLHAVSFDPHISTVQYKVAYFFTVRWMSLRDAKCITQGHHTVSELSFHIRDG